MTFTLDAPSAIDGPARSQRRRTIPGLKELLNGRWHEAIPGITATSVDYFDGSHGPCPRCGGTDRWRVFNDFAETGGAICNQCGKFGDGIATIRGITGWPLPRVLSEANEWADQHCVDDGGHHDGEPSQQVKRQPKKPTSRSAPIDLCHRVYSRFLEFLSLSDEHRQQLRDSGFSDAEIERRGYRTLGLSASIPVIRLRKEFTDQELTSVPGIMPGGAISVGGFPGLLLALRDIDGWIRSIRIRLDHPGSGGKYRSLTSSHKGGPSPGAPCHVPLPIKANGDPIDSRELRITEGELKADYATAVAGILTLGLPGVGSWQQAMPIVEQLQPTRVRIAFDADGETNPAVATAAADLAAAVAALGIEVCAERWPLADGKGIDDLLLAGGTPELLEGDVALQWLTERATRLGSAPQQGQPVTVEQIISRTVHRDYRIPPADVPLIDRAALALDDVQAADINPVDDADASRWSWAAVVACLRYDLDADTTVAVFQAAMRLEDKSLPTEKRPSLRGEWPDEKIRQRLAVAEGSGDVIRGEGLVAFCRGESWDDPYKLARRILLAYGWDPFQPDQLRLRHYRGEFLEWRESAYFVVSEDDIQAHMDAVCQFHTTRESQRLDAAYTAAKRKAEDDDKPPPRKPTWPKVTPHLLRSVLGKVKAIAKLADDAEAPFWIGDAVGLPPAAELISCRNGILHVHAGPDGRYPELIPPTPKLFTRNGLPYEFNPTAMCPAWEEFLRQTWLADEGSTGTDNARIKYREDGETSIRLLQQWFGYQLTPDTRHHKMLAIVGPSRSGKGTIGRTLKEMVGGHNVASPKLSQLAKNFDLESLLGKPVAIIYDARLSHRLDAVAVGEVLLGITGGDPCTVDRKHKQALTNVQLPVRFTLCTNELPALRDMSGALANRFLVVQTTRSWLGQEDEQLEAKLRAELPGILLWALRGRELLERDRKFCQPDSGAELVEQINDLTSPVRVFVAEHCGLDEKFSVTKAELYDHYAACCRNQGIDRPATLAVFSRDLLAAFPGI